LLLYASEDNNFYQYDLRGGSTEAILRSKTLIAQKPDAVADMIHPGLPSFQLGPDGKIYVGIQHHNYLHVIPRPEVVGTGCGFEARAVDLQGKYVFQGLTCFMRSYLMPDKAPEVRMPNVFTPNGDQLNEVFRPIALKNTTDAHLTIYNRWGRLLYQTKDVERGWNGDDHPAGVYYWSLLYNGRSGYECGKRHLVKGFVTLMR
jgi:gliding motility-associated-like protein